MFRLRLPGNYRKEVASQSTYVTIQWKKTNTKEERKPAYWSHNRRALFKMDSPTRRQLVVGFLEPAEKNDISAEEPCDWTPASATHGADQLQPRRSLFAEDVHALWLTGRKELGTLFFNEKTHCSLKFNHVDWHREHKMNKSCCVE